MVVTELIDARNFRSRLVALGIRIPEEACPETCARMALRKHEEGGVPELETLSRELMGHTEMMLPSVRQALERVLLPGLC